MIETSADPRPARLLRHFSIQAFQFYGISPASKPKLKTWQVCFQPGIMPSGE
jgi:hypothetical protein